MKKILCAFLAIVILTASSAGLAAHADPTPEFVSLCDYIASELERGSTAVNVQSYGIHASQVSETIYHVRYTYPDLFYVNLSTPGYTYFDDGTSDPTVYELTFSYNFSESQLETVKAEYEALIEECLADIRAERPVTDLGKVLAVHRFIVRNFEYDASYAQRDAYSALKNRRGVCECYTMAFTALAQRLGLEVSYCRSKDMNHIWNLVKLDGKWYHVDCTRDDPSNVYITLDKTSHENFLKSDAAFIVSTPEAGKHYRPQKPYLCDSGKYDDFFWNGVTSPVYTFAKNDYWYIGSEGDLIHLSGGESAVVISHHDVWTVLDAAGNKTNSYYVGVFSGLEYYKRCFYYNDSTHIYRYSLDTNEETVIYELSAAQKGLIYGIRRNGDVLSAEISFEPQSAGVIITVQLEYTPAVSPMEEAVWFADVVTDGSEETVMLESSLTLAGAGISGDMEVLDRDGNKKTEGLIATGDVISLRCDDGKTVLAEVVLKGDVNGNGKVDEDDHADVKDTLLGNKELEGCYEKAAQISGGDGVTLDDYIAIRTAAIGAEG